MRKRRKSRVVWLPPDIGNRLGTAPSDVTNPEIGSSHIIAVLTGPPLGDPAVTSEFPIVLDQGSASIGGPQGFSDLKQTSLSDVAQSGYRLRRIVGKLFFGAAPSTARVLADVKNVIVTAAFIIRRVDATGNSLAAASGGGLQLSTNTATMNNIMDPWIWRRSWILSNTFDPSSTDAALFGQQNNITYGSAVDGPHVDAKTARIVGPEERLFLDVTTQGIDGNAQSDPLAIVLVGDIRVLGTLRTNVGNRRNASR